MTEATTADAGTATATGATATETGQQATADQQTAAQQAQTTAAAAQQQTAAAQTTAAAHTGGARSLEDLLAPLDDTARAAVLREVSTARQEAGAARTTAKQKAADDARTELAQTIGKALGLIKEDEPVDPAKLTQQLTATQADNRQTKVELAVYKAAGDAGADPGKLLDSRSFADRIKGIDPNDAPAIQAAIQAAVEANAAFATGAPATELDVTVPKPNPAQGSSGSGAPSLDDQIAAAKKDGNVRLALHLTNQQLLPQGR